MQELIETIRAAVATDASAEKKAAGINACRTILTALDTEPGKPLAMPHVLPPPTMASGPPRLPQVSLDQMLDLMIARLTMVANAAETKQLPPAPPTPTAIAPLAAPAAPRGMRVPMAAPNIGKATPRPPRQVPPRKP